MLGKSWTDLKLFPTQLFPGSIISGCSCTTGSQTCGAQGPDSSLFRSIKQEDPNPHILFAHFLLFILVLSHRCKSGIVPILCFVQLCSGDGSCIYQRTYNEETQSPLVLVPNLESFQNYREFLSNTRQHLPAVCWDAVPFTQGRCPLHTQIPIDLQGTSLLPLLIPLSLSKYQGHSTLAVLRELLE